MSVLVSINPEERICNYYKNTNFLVYNFQTRVCIIEFTHNIIYYIVVRYRRATRHIVAC